MKSLYSISLNLFSAAIIILLFIETRHKAEKKLSEDKYFTCLLVSTLVLLIADSFQWLCDGLPGGFQFLLRSSQTVYYFLHPFPPFFYALYQESVLKGEKSNIPPLNKLLLIIPLIISCGLTLVSIRTGWFFYFDSAGFYHRGPWFALFAAITVFYLVLALYRLIFVYSPGDSKMRRALFLYPVFPFIGGLLQTLFYGVTLLWAGTAFSCLIIAHNLQSSMLKTDALTGLFNRRHLNAFLFQNWKNLDQTPFTAILIDLDRFKYINDTFGHLEGDAALVEAAKILSSVLRSQDFIFRYAGDEFVILLDSGAGIDGEDVQKRILRAFEIWNTQHKKPYTLSASIGWGVFQPETDKTWDQFFQKIDSRMYEVKRIKHAESKQPE